MVTFSLYINTNEYKKQKKHKKEFKEKKKK